MYQGIENVISSLPSQMKGKYICQIQMDSSTSNDIDLPFAGIVDFWQKRVSVFTKTICMNKINFL